MSEYQLEKLFVFSIQLVNGNALGLVVMKITVLCKFIKRAGLLSVPEICVTAEWGMVFIERSPAVRSFQSGRLAIGEFQYSQSQN